MQKLFAVSAVAWMASGVAWAGFQATNPGPLNSNGPQGDPGNGVFTYAFAGPDFTPDSLIFEGDVTADSPLTWQSDARWAITNPAGQTLLVQVSDLNANWTGTAHIGPVTINGLDAIFTGTSVGTWRFEAYEFFDDPGLDAHWNNVSFTFTDAVTGACCLLTGSCEVHTLAVCQGLGGYYQGDGITCGATTCPQPCSWGATDYTTESDFVAQLSGSYYLEDFSAYTCGYPLNGTQTYQNFGPTNGISYETHAQLGLWSGFEGLSVQTAFDPIEVSQFYPPVTAIGGIFTATDANCNNITGNIEITLLTTCLQTMTLPNPTPDTFFGFTTSAPIQSVRFNVQNQASPSFVQIAHLYVGTASGPTGCRGDMNCDGQIDFADIDPFVAILSGATPCSTYNADVNGDGAIDFADIDPFVSLLASGATCP